MRVLCIAVSAFAFLVSPSFGGQDAAAPIGNRPDQSAAASNASSDAVQSFRADFERIVDYYASFFEKIGDERRHQMAAEAREGLRAVTDEQLAAAFARSRVPDLTLAVQAVERLEQLPPMAGRPMQLGRTPGLPDKPPVIIFCDKLPHDPIARSIALGAFHLVRTVLASAEFGCQQTVVIAGNGGNNAWWCIPMAIAKDLAEIPWELMSFCAGEDDSALLQGNYDRLAHIHADIDAALSEIRRLSCDLLRIMHTPQGLRQSDIQSCVGQPAFPYNFPEH